MKQKRLLAFTLFLGLGINLGAQTTQEQADQFLKSQPRVFFKENKGQVSDQHHQPRPDVLYYGSDGAMNFHMRKNGISYQLTRVDSWKELEDHVLPHGGDQAALSAKMEQIRPTQKVPDAQTVYRVDVNWLGANQLVQPRTGKTIQGVDNYYNTPDANGVLGVRSFVSVQFTNLYHGIDLKYYEHDGHLKYDYLVAPGADYHHIQLEYKGATSLQIDNEGNLQIETPLGTLYEPLPYVTQNGKQLKANWQINGEVVSFEIENYDATQAMLIDPLVRVWGTYYGGNDFDTGYSVTTDASGNVYLSGWAQSTTQIATAGAFQSTLTGTSDEYVVKFNSNGERVWATYYGGTDWDGGTVSICTDTFGNVYLTASTSSIAQIASGGFQNTFGGGDEDAYLVKFDGAGSRLWATYYGGDALDHSESVTVDSGGNIYLSGYTESTTSIASVGAFQTVFGGVYDAFLVKFDASGNRLWATYYGGDDDDEGYSVATDTSGNVFLTGIALSTTQIASAGAFQTTYSGGGSFGGDAFLAKFDATGNRLWGTYFGGSGFDRGNYVATDRHGNIYLTGDTESTTDIAFEGFQISYAGGIFDSYLVKFDEDGQRMWSTYYGGEDIEINAGVATDTAGNICIAGYTGSLEQIAFHGFQDTLTPGGDAFAAKFDSDGQRLWGTYYGGEEGAQGLSTAVDVSGDVYLAGYTTSTTQMADGGFQNTYGGGYSDAFLVKFTDSGNAGLEESADEVFVVYPNPANEIINVEMSSIEGLKELTLLSPTGQIVSSINTSDEQTTINVTGFAKGVYFMRLISGKGTTTKTVVIK